MISKSLLINYDPNIENQNILHIGRLPARATIVPANKRGVYYQNKFESECITSLNGDYKFKYVPEDTEKNFYRTDVSDSDWDVIDVPSMWQYRGYGKPEYPNIRYSIPFLPPYVKKQNPVGLYRRAFFVSSPAERTILHFSGVDNAFYVYLNGEMIGFSKGVGIMHTRVSGNKFLVNEHPIYIKGVNRHENDPWNGRTLTVEQIRHDLEMIKENNLNAIRLSHYPNDPSTHFG